MNTRAATRLSLLLALLLLERPPAAAAAAAAPAAAAAAAQGGPPPSPSPAPAPPDADPGRLRRANGTYYICISPAPPHVFCRLGVSSGLTPVGASSRAASPATAHGQAAEAAEGAEGLSTTGYQVQLFEQALASSDFGWKRSRVAFRCLDWQRMISDLDSPEGTCQMALSVDILSEYADRGIQFTWPTSTMGLKILVRGQFFHRSLWSFFGAFDSKLWIALFATVVLVGLLVALMQRCSDAVRDAAQAAEQADAAAAAAADAEAPSPEPADGAAVAGPPCLAPRGKAVPPGAGAAAAGRPGRRPGALRLGGALRRLRAARRLEAAAEAADHVWGVLATTFNANSGTLAPEQAPGRLVYLAWAFVSTILISLFTANTAGILTTMRLSSTIRSRADLSGKAVATWEGYVDILANTELIAAPLPWENDADLEAMKDKLLAGSIKALVIDASTVDWIAAFNSSCQLFAVGDAIMQWGNGWAFPVNTSASVVQRWNEVLLSLQENTNTMDMLRQKWWGLDGSTCKARAADEFQVELADVAGLWVLLAIAVAAALALLLALYCGRHHRSIQRLAASALRPPPGAGGGGGGGAAAPPSSSARSLTLALMAAPSRIWRERSARGARAAPQSTCQG